MNANLKLLRFVARSSARLAIEINERTKASRFTTDDGDHQWKPQRTGTGKGFRCPTNPKPDRKWILHRSWIHTLTGERGAMFSRPVNQFVFTDVEEQIKLLRKQ